MVFRKMQSVRVSSQQVPVQKLGDSQLILSPECKLAATQSSLLDPSLESELGEPLIPGLPDDVALNCLIRLPVESHTPCKAVSRRWYQLLGSKEKFFTRRKEFGLNDPWLFVFAFRKCTGKIEWQVFDIKKLSWHSFPAMPCGPRKEKVCPHGFRCVSIPHEGALFVCGGVVSDMDCPLNMVLKYEVQKNRWSVMKKMITARSFFASGIVDGMIYVAGGNSTDLFELNSAEVMDPHKGTWRPIASMGTNMTSYDAAVLNGKLLVTEGWSWPFYVVPRGQIYDPRTDNWENMAAGLREGWTGSSAVVYDHLFVVSEHERMKLKVYYTNTDCWEAVAGAPLPEQICKPFSVNCCESRIYVVGRNLYVAVGHILRTNPEITSENKWSFSVQWKVVDAPAAFSDLVPTSAQVLFA